MTLKSTNYWEFIVKAKKLVLFLFSAIYVSACGDVTPIPPTGTSTPEVTIKTSTPNPAMTATVRPTLFYGWTSTPETVFGYPTAVMPFEEDPFAKNVPLIQTELTAPQLHIGKYVLRNWCKDDETISSYCVITISALGEEPVEIWGLPVYLGAETGSDITGNGYPNIVVIEGIGNAGGDVFVRVFEVGDTLKEIMNVGSRGYSHYENFVDLNNDNSYEFVAHERIWSQFSNCQAMDTPLIYEYSSNSGYVNQTSKYKEVLSPNIQWGLDQISSYKTENPNTKTPLCNLYYLLTVYVVSGQQEKAWALLEENYPPEKVAEYKAGLLKDLEKLIQK
jgi:hypothetical protein